MNHISRFLHTWDISMELWEVPMYIDKPQELSHEAGMTRMECRNVLCKSQSRWIEDLHKHLGVGPLSAAHSEYCPFVLGLIVILNLFVDIIYKQRTDMSKIHEAIRAGFSWIYFTKNYQQAMKDFHWFGFQQVDICPSLHSWVSLCCHNDDLQNLITEMFHSRRVCWTPGGWYWSCPWWSCSCRACCSNAPRRRVWGAHCPRLPGSLVQEGGRCRPGDWTSGGRWPRCQTKHHLGRHTF